MATVSKKIADDVIAGKYDEDNWVRIVKYTNQWDGESYGLENKHTLGKYEESSSVNNPTVYWEKV